MVKRLFWLLVGFVAGVGSSVWVALRLRRTVARYAPPEVADRVGASVSALRRDLRDAVVEGREAMHAREAELRERSEPLRSVSLRSGGRPGGR